MTRPSSVRLRTPIAHYGAFREPTSSVDAKVKHWRG